MGNKIGLLRKAARTRQIRAERGLLSGVLAQRRAALVIRSCRRAIMGEDATDQSLLDVSGLGPEDWLDESALTRALKRIMTSSAEGPSNSFQANI
jgi:hypothetical protein